MNIQEIREKYPQYNDLSDTQLATALHQKFYADIPFDDFSDKIGLTQQPAFTGRIPEGMDVRDFDVNASDIPPGFVPEPPKPKTFKEKLFGREGTPLMPGAEVVKFAYENPDVVLSTAASLAAPQLALPAWASRLSQGGSIARTVAPVVSTAITNAPQLAAAGVGGAVGGGVKEALNNPEATLGSIGREVLESGGEQALAEGVGIGTSALAGKLLAPGAKVVTQEARKVLDFAKEHGLKVNPARIAPSGTAKVVDEATDAVVTGRAAKYFLGDKKIAKVLDTANPDANNLITQVTKVYGENSPGLEQTVKSASKAIQDGLEQWQPKVEAKYLKFTEAIGGRERWTPYPKLREVMEQIKASESALAGGKDEVTTGFISNFLGKYSGQVSAEDLYKQYKRLGKIKGDKHNIGLLRDAFKAEFADLASATSDDAIKLLNEANKEYVLGKKYFKNNKVVKDIAAGALEENKVTVRLFRDGEYSTLRQLEANIPKENFDNLLRLNLENIIQNNSVAGENPFIKILDGRKLLSWIDKNPKTFGLYPKETQEAVRNLALYAKYHMPEALSGSKDFMSAVTGSALKTGALGTTLKFAGADLSGAGVVIPSIAAPAMAWDMMNPGGLLTRWLTGSEGPLTAGAKEGLKVGGRLVFQDRLQNREQLE